MCSHHRSNVTPDVADAEMRAAVMRILLSEHPALLTIDELIRELTGESQSERVVGDVRRAIRDLSGAGLVHLVGEFAFATHAACAFARLELD